MQILPTIIPIDVKCSCPYLWAVGVSSSRVTKIITPAAKASVIATNGLKISRNNAAVKAPIGSTKPEIKANLKLLNLEAPLLNKGRATIIPSGMLCKAIAMAMIIPKLGKWRYPAPIEIPSGML